MITKTALVPTDIYTNYIDICARTTSTKTTIKDRDHFSRIFVISCRLTLLLYHGRYDFTRSNHELLHVVQTVQ